jgi:hypothetical protein
VKSPKLLEERVFLTYAYLYEAACLSIEQAKTFEGDKGLRTYHYLSSILFSAFCIEAYLNHVGEKLLHLWDTSERLKTQEKLEMIAAPDQLNLPLDLSCRPFQSFRELFKFRDSIVHGRTEESSTTRPVGRQSQLSSKLERLATQKRAERFLYDIKAIICQIHGKIDSSKSPFDELAYRRISVAPKDE